MKIKFNPNLQYQQDAIAAVRDIFDGQPNCTSGILFDPNEQSLYSESVEGIVGNPLRLRAEDLARNVQRIQLRNGLSSSQPSNGMNFTVEMETGTGKTYVYLRTIFELNRAYGFTKFIIVVPSVAIKEGVFKSLQMTEDHFRSLYANTRFDYFVYDSQKLGQVRNFAVSDYIQIMIINIDAFRRSFQDPAKEDKANIIHRPHDAMTGYRPIEVIQDTHPIVIIDEPQSVDTTQKSKEAIGSLNPLCAIRYSATHIDKYNMVYRLDSIDAYQRGLVKQIEVAGIEVEGDHNQAYLKLIEVDNKRNRHRARVEMDVLSRQGKVRRMVRTIRCGDDLAQISGRREIYAGFVVSDIDCRAGDEHLRFAGRPEILRLHEPLSEWDDDQLKRIQIRQTILEHLNKELVLHSRGVKVLSLFFVDRVANYRHYDDQGRPQKGKYALMFEEEYVAAITKPEYHQLHQAVSSADEVASLHGGYFAVDKKRDAKGNEMLKESRGRGTAQADENAYQLIMKDKERLLSFDSSLKFIFSHSALREGWDNPNVFQICTLNETASVIKKRQEIGRGLRIAVNQQGERVSGQNVNRLTVMANESYEQFASQLQAEIEQDTGVRFGIVEPHLFANICREDVEQDAAPIGVDGSQQIWQWLVGDGFIDTDGRVCDRLKVALSERTVIVPQRFESLWPNISRLLRKVIGSLRIRNASVQRQPDAGDVAIRCELQDMLTQIKAHSTFRVDFNPALLVAACVQEIRGMPEIGPARFAYRKTRARIDRGGLKASRSETTSHELDAGKFPLPDIVHQLQESTKLTRRSVVEILIESGRLEDFKNNPQRFIERVTTIISRQMRLQIGDGVCYQKVAHNGVYIQELICSAEAARLRSMIEQNLYEENGVKWCDRLPADFKVETPLGTFQPGWAILKNVDRADYLYFLRE